MCACPDVSPEFAVTVEQVHGRAIVTACGEVDVATAPVLRQALMKASGAPDRDSGNHHVVVDLSGVTFLDACGLGVLLAAALRARRAGTDLILRNPSRLTVRLLEITALGRAFRLEGGGHEGSTLAASPDGRAPAREVA